MSGSPGIICLSFRCLAFISSSNHESIFERK
jgi:hypothetical protein